MKFSSSRREGFLTCGLLFLIATIPVMGNPLPRADLNPALIYWQALDAFSFKPQSGQRPNQPGPGAGTQDGLTEEDEVRQWDRCFQLLRRAAAIPPSVPCDWGFDPADGPHMGVVNLVKLRRLTMATRKRARLALDEGREEDARADLVAMIYLGRRSAHAQPLVSAMIQIAVEDNLIDFIGKNLGQFSSRCLMNLVEDMNRGPELWTVTDAMEAERKLFFEWALAKLRNVSRDHADDDGAAMDACRGFLGEWLQGDESLMEQVLQVSGKTSHSLVDRFQSLSTVYEKMKRVSRAGPRSVARHSLAFQEALARHAHPLASAISPDVGKARRMELKYQIRRALLEAAAGYQADGREGLMAVKDPFSAEPFVLKSSQVTGSQVRIEMQSGTRMDGEPVTSEFLLRRNSRPNK